MKKIKQTAKQLFALSVKNEQLDEKRITQIVQTLTQEKPLHYIRILEYYKKLVEQFLTSKQLIIEVPKGFDTKQVTLKTSKEVVIREDNHILSGVRVLDGDWIFDNTINAKLESLYEHP